MEMWEAMAGQFSGPFSAVLNSAASSRPLARHWPSPQGCLVVPSKDYSHGQALLHRPESVKGERPKTISRAQKKDHENYITN